MRLYHGSNVEIDVVNLSLSKVGKDFGIGFYLSADREQAFDMARRKAAQTESGEPILNVYEFDVDNKEIGDLSILKFDGYTKEWAEFILKNRQNRSRRQIHDYDIVIGPIADDTVGFQIRRFSAGIINIETFIEELKYKRITLQYFFATPKALTFLQKTNEL